MEDGSALSGIYWDGSSVQTFRYLQGDLREHIAGLCFLTALLVELVILGLFWLFWVRKRNGRQKGERYFLSVRTRISLSSIAIAMARGGNYHHNFQHVYAAVFQAETAAQQCQRGAVPAGGTGAERQCGNI